MEDTLEMSAEQEGVAGTPSGAEETPAGEGEKEQPLAAAAEAGEDERQEEFNRLRSAARRQGKREAERELDEEIAAKGYMLADGRPISSKAEMYAYFEQLQEQQLQAEAARQKRSVDELRREQRERAEGRAAMRKSTEEQSAREFMRRDLEEFREEFPEVDPVKLIQGEDFAEFAGSRLGKERLSDLYASYKKLFGKSGSAAKRAEKNGRSTSGGSGSGANSLSTAQQKALDEWNATYPEMKMTAQEFLKMGT